MTDNRPKGSTPTHLPRRHGGGVVSNRECLHCRPPCQGGEVLHRQGRCCHSYCPCEGFEVKPMRSIVSELNAGVKGASKATGAKW